MAIVKEVASVPAPQCEGRVNIENNTMGLHAGNDFFQRTTHSVAAQTRIMLDALEAKCHSVFGCPVALGSWIDVVFWGVRGRSGEHIVL